MSDTLFFYNSTDSTAIDVREKPLKKEKVLKVKKKRGRKRKDDLVSVIVIDVNPRNNEETKIAIEGDKLLIKMGFHTKMNNHYNHRSSVERVNSYLKDSFGCKHIYVKGATKVASHLMFGVLALCIHQSIKLLT